MRILHLVDSLKARGGAQVHLAAVARSQAEAGHQVNIAGAGANEASAAAWPCEVRTVAGLDARTRVPAPLDELIAGLAPDLVHVHTVVNPWVLEWAGARGAVITVQDHRYFCPGRGRWTLAGDPCRAALARDTCGGCFEDGAYFGEVWDLTRARLRALERLEVVALSRYMRDELVAAGLRPERVHVVPPFVDDLAVGEPAAGPPCVLFVGRLVEAKGVRPAVEAWRRSQVGLPLAMAGTGPLREWAASAGAEVLGWVPRERLRGVYGRAAVVVLPPLWQEPFGIAGLEALTLGIPVAAWRSGGIPEWHPGDASLVDWGDVAGLANALRWSVGRRPLPPAGFDRATLMDRLHAVYGRVLGGSCGGRSVVFSSLQ